MGYDGCAVSYDGDAGSTGSNGGGGTGRPGAAVGGCKGRSRGGVARAGSGSGEAGCPPGHGFGGRATERAGGWVSARGPVQPAVPSRPGQAALQDAALRGHGPGGHRRRETARRAGVSAGARHRLSPTHPHPTPGPPGGGKARGGGGERAAGFWRETGAVGAGKPAEPLGGLTPIAGPRRPPSPQPTPAGPGSPRRGL